LESGHCFCGQGTEVSGGRDGKISFLVEYLLESGDLTAGGALGERSRKRFGAVGNAHGSKGDHEKEENRKTEKDTPHIRFIVARGFGALGKGRSSTTRE
jgi:hypothetical protein